MITNLRKNALFRHAEFELSNLTQPDSIWVKLHRSREKPGTVFELLRKVIAIGGEEEDNDQSIKSSTQNVQAKFAY